MNLLLEWWKNIGLSGRIIVGLLLGIAVGLFFGESATVLDVFGKIYIRLMQMTVLPYLITALVVAIGQLEVGEAKKLAVRAGLMLVMIWGIMAVVLFAMPFAYPPIAAASFFSSALVEPTEPFSLTDIYFTANPFESMSRNVVPAVVLFSTLLGVALMRHEKKSLLLEPLRVWNSAIVRITEYVIALTPYGVFALVAVTAGTMTAETFIRLEAYFVTFAAASLVLGFVVLPLAVTAVTPFRYGEVVGIARDALITAFFSHSAFIVLPILVQRSKDLFEKHGLLDEKTDSAADVMIPILFNFPNAGKLLTLLFIPFVAWLIGNPFSGGDFGTLLSAGIPSYFAKAQIALPFLLDLFGLPHDYFRLYIPTTIVTGKFDSLVTAMNLLVFAMLGAAALGGFLVFEARRLLRAGAAMIGALALAVVVSRLLLGAMIDTGYRLDEVVRSMQSSDAIGEVIIDRVPPAGDEGLSGLTHLERIRERGTLRIGFDENNLPFSFFNRDGDLVGFDVELAARLATTMGVTAEFVPIDWNELPDMLATGVIDIMPGMWYRPNWLGRVRLAAPYVTGTMGFATRDERRHEFSNVDALRNSTGLRIGIPLDRRQVQYSINRYFGDADVEFVVSDFWQPFFEGEMDGVDAFLMPAEQASGWSILHPEYSVVVPQPDPIRVTTAFGLALDANDLAAVVDEWTTFALDTGEVDRAYDYWILGQGAEPTAPRWSVLRDVLGLGTN